MRTETIREFILLAETLNYTKTARALNITQSTLSKHMINLERDTGLSLLNHSVSEPKLTEVGHLFLERFTMIDSEAGAALRDCAALQDADARILKIQSAELSVIFPILKSRMASYATERKVTSKFVEIAQYGEVWEAVATGAVDIGLDAIPMTHDVNGFVKDMADHGITATQIKVDSLVMWARKGHPLISKRQIGFEDIRDLSIITSSGKVFDSVQKVLKRIYTSEEAQPRFRKFFFEDHNYGFTYFSLTDFQESLLFTTTGMVNEGYLAKREDIGCRILEAPVFQIRIFALIREQDRAAREFVDYCHYDTAERIDDVSKKK